MISQTSGHGDFRLRSEVPARGNAPLSMAETAGMAMIAMARRKCCAACASN